MLVVFGSQDEKFKESAVFSISNIFLAHIIVFLMIPVTWSVRSMTDSIMQFYDTNKVTQLHNAGTVAEPQWRSGEIRVVSGLINAVLPDRVSFRCMCLFALFVYSCFCSFLPLIVSLHPTENGHTTRVPTSLSLSLCETLSPIK